MAEAHWIGVTGDFSANGNWSTSRYGAAAGNAPTTNSDVIIEDVGVPPSTNLSAITADLASIQISTSRGIGSTTTPLKVQVSGTSGLTYAGIGSLSGVVLVRAQNALVHISTATGGIDVLCVHQTAGGQVLVSGTTAAIPMLLVERDCTVLVDTGAPITAYRQLGGSLEMEYCATAVTTAESLGGNTFIKRSITTGTVDPAGTLRMADGVGNTATAFATAYVRGRLIYWASGAITACTTYPGGEATAKGSKVSFVLAASTKWAGSKMFEDTTNFSKTAATVVVGGSSV